MGNQRFVVQKHTTAEGIHWDLTLEYEGALVTFRLAEPPEAARHHTIRAQKIFDHPAKFLTYEGPVQKGTGRVRIVDRGTFRHGDQAENLWTVCLEGTILNGDFTLRQMAEDVWPFTAEPRQPHRQGGQPSGPAGDPIYPVQPGDHGSHTQAD